MPIVFDFSGIVPETTYQAQDGSRFDSYEECAKYEITQQLEEYVRQHHGNIYRGFTIVDLLSEPDLCRALWEFHSQTVTQDRFSELTEMFASEEPEPNPNEPPHVPAPPTGPIEPPGSIHGNPIDDDIPF